MIKLLLALLLAAAPSIIAAQTDPAKLASLKGERAVEVGSSPKVPTP